MLKKPKYIAIISTEVLHKYLKKISKEELVKPTNIPIKKC